MKLSRLIGIRISNDIVLSFDGGDATLPHVIIISVPHQFLESHRGRPPDTYESFKNLPDITIWAQRPGFAMWSLVRLKQGILQNTRRDRDSSSTIDSNMTRARPSGGKSKPNRFSTRRATAMTWAGGAPNKPSMRREVSQKGPSRGSIQNEITSSAALRKARKS